MKTEPTPITENNQDLAINHQLSEPDCRVYQNYVPSEISARLERSRRKNIRRAWRLRKAYDELLARARFVQKYFRNELKNHAETKAQLAAITKQRDEKPKRIVLTELPMEEPLMDDNTYLTLHDHYIQTAKLRARVKELEKQISSLFLHNDSEKLS